MKKTVTIVLSTLTMIALSGTVFAWVEPDQMPPNGNIAAPLNTGSFAQTKLGGLLIGFGNVAYGLIVKNGNSGFGLEQPTERVDVNGNIKLNGRIIGLQAPTDGNDAVNKNYVDAMGGGGGTYTAWGKTECASGWTKAYEGVALNSVTVYDGAPSISGSNTLCIIPDNLSFVGNNFSQCWVSAEGRKTSCGKNLPCAVCVK